MPWTQVNQDYLTGRKIKKSVKQPTHLVPGIHKLLNSCTSSLPSNLNLNFVLFSPHRMPIKKCVNYSDDSARWHKNFIGAYRLYASPGIGILGILGNIIVIVVFLLEHKKSRFSIYCIAISSTHVIILLVNSIMDDFMGGGFEYWQKGFQIKFDTYSLAMCRLMEYVPNCMYTASSGLLLVFSIDRIMTIFKPMQFYSIHYRKLAIYICLSVVVISAIITVPMLLASNLKIQKGMKKCTINHDQVIGPTSVFIKVFVTFVIPTFVILILNVVICLKLWRAKIQRARLFPGDLQKNNLEMNRICGHLALNTMFLLFTFPLVISMLMRQINDCSSYNKSLSQILSSIKDISYSLDFLLYFIFLTNFRWRFIKYLVAPLFCCGILRTSYLGLYIDSKLIKHDSNSSRRKYSAIAAAFSSSNNQYMFSVLMYKSSGQISPKKPMYCHSSSNSTETCRSPIVPPHLKERHPSLPNQKTVSYASDVKDEVEGEFNDHA